MGTNVVYDEGDILYFEGKGKIIRDGVDETCLRIDLAGMGQPKIFGYFDKVVNLMKSEKPKKENSIVEELKSLKDPANIREFKIRVSKWDSLIDILIKREEGK
jgi:hypothetical protein